MEEEKETSCIAILPRSSHDIDVVMLDEEISNSILQQNWIVRGGIILQRKHIQDAGEKTLNSTNVLLIIEWSQKLDLRLLK